MQQPYFYGDLTLLDNININYLFSKKVSRKTIEKYSKTLQIDTILKQKASLCSGGEKARANLLRGLLLGKPIILIDEPTAHLDQDNSQIVATILHEISKEKIVIVTTHERQFFNFDNTIFLTMNDGNLYEN
jgi:ABC-type lipoprotein export system ATPase subunit